MMPQIYAADMRARLFVGAREVHRILSGAYDLVPLAQQESTTENLFRLRDGGETRLGIISAMSAPFCHRCNKIRLLPDGTLKTCLYGAHGVNLKDMVREGRSPRYVERAIRDAVREKPRSMQGEHVNPAMHQTGG
jgi:cyclic pyranopterin phosphate synthase